LTQDGQCSVTWTSAAPRPVDDFGTFGLAVRITILASIIGEEGFTDSSPSNGRFDDGETFTDLPEVFLDINENGTRDTSEEYIDFDGSGDYTFEDGVYNGTLCSDTASQCSTTPSLVTVSDDLTLVMASEQQGLTVYDVDDNPLSSVTLQDNGAVVNLSIEIEDARGQLPPTGSSISVSTTKGEIMGSNSTDIPETNAQGPASLSIAIRATNQEPSPGALTVSLDMPGNACDGGSTIKWNIPVNVEDVSGPIVTDTTPAFGATDVDVNSGIQIAFSDDIAQPTIDSANIFLTPTVAGTLSYDTANRTVFFFPDNPLAADQRYTLTITTGITDTDGNALNNGDNNHEVVFRTAP
jgi:hypothetical protein